MLGHSSGNQLNKSGGASGGPRGLMAPLQHGMSVVSNTQMPTEKLLQTGTVGKDAGWLLIEASGVHLEPKPAH
eukprot:2833070-Pyramimonas_sp.AAC.1